MQNRKKIVFLYFELAGYFLSCIDKLIELYDAEVHIVKYPVNAVAPFRFKLNPKIRFYDYDEYRGDSLIKLVHQIDPEIIYICGWSNKDYVKCARTFRKKIPLILTFDNPWRGTFKQYIAVTLGKAYLNGIFTHCWVPGEPNARYARRLGFKGNRLFTGMYSADHALFYSYYLQFREKKKKSFPKKFLFAGRYIALKGIRELWQAFLTIQNESPNEWELWCIGKGELENEFPVHDKIRNFGFIQPEEMHNYLEQAGVFILPTHYEHWGVVVHEFAAAGFPLICTNTTSAATTFLQDGVNGYMIEPYSIDAIIRAMKKIISMTDEELNGMADKSAEISSVVTPQTWAQTLMSIR